MSFTTEQLSEAPEKQTIFISDQHSLESLVIRGSVCRDLPLLGCIETVNSHSCFHARCTHLTRCAQTHTSSSLLCLRLFLVVFFFSLQPFPTPQGLAKSDDDDDEEDSIEDSAIYKPCS